MNIYKTLIFFGILFWIFIYSPYLFAKENKKIVLRMIGPEDVTGAWHEIIKRFEKKYPNIKIRYITGPSDTSKREEMYIRSFLGGDPIELVYMDVIWIAKFASKGWLLPLDKYFTKEMREKFLAPDIKAGEFKGHIYRIPVKSDVGVLYYRKDIVKTPPKTWNEFEKVCKNIPSNMYCFVFQGKQYEGLVCNFLEFLWGAGGDIFDKNGKVIIGSSKTLEALKFMRKIIKNSWAPKSVLSFQEQHALNTFAQGKAVFMRNWPYAWRVLNAPNSKLKGKIGIAPLFHAKNSTSHSTLGGWGLGIASKTKYPDLAWKFIEFVTSEEAQKIIYKYQGALPSLKKLYFDPEIFKDNPQILKFYQILKNAKPRPVHSEYPRISDIIQIHTSAVLSGIETPEEAVKEMEKSINSIVKTQKVSLIRRILIDTDLHKCLLNTLKFTILSVPLELLLGFLIALLLNEKFRFRSFARISAIIPWALPTAVMALSWQWMFTDPFGVINDILIRLELINKPIPWLSTPLTAMLANVIADVWKTTPFVIIILLAGLQSIPKTLIEAMKIDGAGYFTIIRCLILPLLLPYIGVALIFRLINAVGIFDLIWVLTHGGPANSTKTIALYIYDVAFRYDDINYALVLTILLTLILIILTYGITKITRPKYEE